MANTDSNQGISQPLTNAVVGCVGTHRVDIRSRNVVFMIMLSDTFLLIVHSYKHHFL